MKQRQIIMMTVMVHLLAATRAVLAFPGWIGVYGDYERHEGGNPGTFTVLMNQDYHGLHAEVGFQVNGGAWNTLPMLYAGKVDGNSLWRVSPDASFESGATVNYYFHGWDDWGGHTWDSNSGGNYTFVAETVEPAPLLFGGLHSLARPYWPAQQDAAALGVMDYVITSEDSGLRVWHRNTADGTTQRTLLRASTSSAFAHVAIAADAEAILAAYADEDGLTVYRSVDGGLSYAVVAEAVPGGTPKDVQLAQNDRGAFSLAILLDSGLHVSSSQDHGAVWTALSPLDAAASANLALCGSPERFYLLYDADLAGSVVKRYQDSAEGASWLLRSAGPLPAGQPTRLAYIRGVGPAVATPGTQLFRMQSGLWASWQTVPQASESLPALVEGPDGELVLFHVLYDEGAYRVSTDGGSTWSGQHTFPLAYDRNLYSSISPRPLPPHLDKIVARDGRIGLLWFLNNFHVGNYTTRWQTGLAVSPPLAWVDNTGHQPANGQLDAGEELWLHAQTYPSAAAQAAHAVYSTDGATWFSVPMTPNGVFNGADAWQVSLGTFAPGTVIQYAIEAVDGRGDAWWDSNGGQDYFAVVNEGYQAEVSRIDDGAWLVTTGSGGSCGYANGNAWIDIAVLDLGSAKTVGIVWSADGGATWQASDASLETDLGNGRLQFGVDVTPVGTLSNCPGGTTALTFQYAIFYTVDGVTYWDNNAGQDYVIHVGL